MFLSGALTHASTALTAPLPAGTEETPVLFGAYPGGQLQTSIDRLNTMNDWLVSQGASGVTFFGDFMSITFNPSGNVEARLEAAWSNNFMPFVNLNPSASWEGSYYQEDCDSSEDIAQGRCDPYLRTWAGYFKTWAGDTKRAFIAPLPEANGDWANYSTDGSTFIEAFRRFQEIFQEEGVPDDAVHWVFAPNAWHDPDYPSRAFENYYPGDSYVDIVAFSSYNYGGCPDQWASWVTFEDAFEPYLDRMQSMAPSKPIIIAQTGTVDVPVDPGDPSQNKSEWVRNVFGQLADYPGVRGIIYFNVVKENEPVGSCEEPDYRIFYGDTGEPGFVEVMADSGYGQWDVTDPKWDEINSTVTDPNTIPAMDILGNGYSIFDGDSVPSTADGTDFGDVNIRDGTASQTFTIVNEGGVDLNLTGSPPVSITGTNAGDFSVTLLPQSSISSDGGTTSFEFTFDPSTDALRTATLTISNDDPYRDPYSFAIQGTGITTFSDVPSGYWAYQHIEALWAGGYTAGCQKSGEPLKYCPETILNRGMSGVFILRGEYGNTYSPPSEPWDTFHDDWSTIQWAEQWAEGMWEEGFTAGCQKEDEPLQYCPLSQLSRAEASVFGLHLKYGNAYQPPAASGTVFADMTDPEHWATAWAEQAYKDELLPACGQQDGKPLFCPEDELNRAWAAYLIVQAKNLTLPTP